MAFFMDRMYSHSDHFTTLWFVSIFSGLIWGFGMIHIFSTNRATLTSIDSGRKSFDVTHVVSIFEFPDALGSHAGVFLSSFMMMCVFGAGLLYAIGYVCVKSENVLFLFLVYFIVSLVFLPAAHPLQQVLRLDAEKMQLFRFMVSTFVSGYGFYYNASVWHKSNLLLFAAVQGTATGLLHVFGRVLCLDCLPAGKEGVFLVWFSWARERSDRVEDLQWQQACLEMLAEHGVSFCARIVGMVVLIFGNISSLRGAKATGHVTRVRRHFLCMEMIIFLRAQL
ncbi:hypothetical protein PHJA_001214500 [Phtheirospermum japonicum]|uniref:Uncharacterized protein n=1 Tax=Phtheirospermum japonicum TaxID=374723 RepID=A0A830C343_9LAMI|nr:hypothetical protein PHJA_001214500 [Phtheirospermum japonicum]